MKNKGAARPWGRETRRDEHGAGALFRDSTTLQGLLDAFRDKDCRALGVTLLICVISMYAAFAIFAEAAS